MTVYLVGAGPGDPGLLTVRGKALLERAEVVVHDRLVDEQLLRLAPAAAEVLDMGKQPGGEVTQQQVDELLVDRGRRHGVVVRLKGGDPFVFGRGGEEALALAAAGVPFEVVPGVTAAVAVPAYAGVPMTHRGLASSFTVVSGRGAQDSAAPVDWPALARLGGTLVLMMGVAPRAEVAARLIAGGRAPTTPVLVVENGTVPDQRSTRTTLGELGATPVAPPATIVVGEVAALDLAWFERRPLLGWRVVVTRTRTQASVLASLLAAEAAVPVELPAIEIVPPADGGTALAAAASRLAGYDWVVLTSANGVEQLFSQLHDARAFGSARVAAIGPGTAAALAARGVRADLVPAEYVAESLLAALIEVVPSGGRVLLARAAQARDVLPDGLRAAGVALDVVEAYRTARPEPAPGLLAAVEAADAVTFTSSSTVSGFVAQAGAERVPPVVACIGPVTAEAAGAAGLTVDAVAAEHTLEGLVRALAGVASRRGRPPR